MKLLCKVFGHNVSDLAPHPVCDRCGAYDYNADVWTDFDYYGLRTPIVKLRRFKNECVNGFQWKHRSVKNWLTCSECGWHFGKHNEKVDHVPF